jgi:hypothetical protein
VAVAAKLARIAWAVLRHGRDYEHQAVMVSRRLELSSEARTEISPGKLAVINR